MLLSIHNRLAKMVEKNKSYRVNYSSTRLFEVEFGIGLLGHMGCN